MIPEQREKDEAIQNLFKTKFNHEAVDSASSGELIEDWLDTELGRLKEFDNDTDDSLYYSSSLGNRRGTYINPIDEFMSQQKKALGMYDANNDVIHMYPSVTDLLATARGRSDAFDRTSSFMQLLADLGHEMQHKYDFGAAQVRQPGISLNDIAYNINTDVANNEYVSEVIPKANKVRPSDAAVLQRARELWHLIGGEFDDDDVPLNSDLEPDLEGYESIRRQAERLLQQGPNGMDWIDKPTEWNAIAREIGYIVHRTGTPVNTDAITKLDKELGGALHYVEWMHNISTKKWPNALKQKVSAIFFNKIKEAAEIGEFKVSDEDLKEPSLEQKLLTAAEGYKGTDDIGMQLLMEAQASGLDTRQATALVQRVLARLNKTETGRTGGAFGVPHDPVKQKNNLATSIGQRRF
jgi:hypothetical protein